MNSSRPVLPAVRRILAVVALAAVFTATFTLTTAASAEAKGLNLHRGSKGATVRTLEVRLDRLNLLAPSAVDRRYTQATVVAVKKFQRRQHLRPTGRVNAVVWNRLARAVRAAAAKPAPTPAPKPPTTPAPAIIGHRGVVSPDVPENTLLAMRRAAPSVQVLEFDLQLTSDGKLVLMHDATLTRTTNCTGSVISWTLANIRSKCRTGGQPIPTFDEVAAYAATTSLKISPEIKNKEVTDADLAAIFATIDKHGLAARTILQSFEDPILQRVHELRPDLRLLLLSTRPIPVSQAQAVGATTVGIRLEYLTAADVTAYRSSGLKTWTYTAIDAPTLDQARRLRVDAVFTDVPAMAKSRYGS